MAANKVVFCVLIALVAATACDGGSLRRYVDRADDSFEFELVRSVQLDGADGYIIRLTSQMWRDIRWQHWLSVVVPHQRKHADKALLIVEGGRNREDVPEIDQRVGTLLSYLSNNIGSAIAVLQQVPNQPLLEGRYEDDLIAYTFDRYMATGESDWPLLKPMVKSTVAAMDAITQWSADQYDQAIEEFFVAGASKRGWTTWLTAAVDQRVTGIAPIVIDVLNMQKQMERQMKTYGSYSDMIRDYAEHGVLDRMGHEAAEQLLEVVDPYSYRQDITVPKLIVLGTNDPYWTVDAANLYVPDLVGPVWLHYRPNSGHDLGISGAAGEAMTIATLASFINANFNGWHIPTLSWHYKQEDTLVVEWDGPGRAKLWTAESVNRDFRGSTWLGRGLSGSERVEVQLSEPEKGWSAWFVEVRFEGDYPMSLSTTMTVLPDEFPFE